MVAQRWWWISISRVDVGGPGDLVKVKFGLNIMVKSSGFTLEE